MIVIDGELTTDVIHDVWGSRPAFAVRTDSRVMDFRRRPGPDEPDAQVIEDGPDHRRVFDADDDPHGTIALRTDQGIDLPGLRDCVAIIFFAGAEKNGL